MTQPFNKYKKIIINLRCYNATEYIEINVADYINTYQYIIDNILWGYDYRTTGYHGVLYAPDPTSTTIKVQQYGSNMALKIFGIN